MKMRNRNEGKRKESRDLKSEEEYFLLQPDYDLIQIIVEARKSQKITQKELSDRTGITQADISRIENGNRNPSLAMVKKIVAGLGMQLKLEPIPTEKIGKN